MPYGLATLAEILSFCAVFSTLFCHFLVRNFAPQNSKARNCEGNNQEIARNSVMKSCRMKNSWIWEFKNLYRICAELAQNWHGIFEIFWIVFVKFSRIGKFCARILHQKVTEKWQKKTQNERISASVACAYGWIDLRICVSQVTPRQYAHVWETQILKLTTR